MYPRYISNEEIKAIIDNVCDVVSMEPDFQRSDTLEDEATDRTLQYIAQNIDKAIMEGTSDNLIVSASDVIVKNMLQGSDQNNQITDLVIRRVNKHICVGMTFSQLDAVFNDTRRYLVSLGFNVYDVVPVLVRLYEKYAQALRITM